MFPNTVSKLVKKVQTNRNLTDRKLLKKKLCFIEEELDDVGHRLENSP
jgi:hypothetical protein